MTKKKDILLNKALDKIYSIGFGLEPDDFLEEYFSEKLMIIGTTHDEQFSSLKGLRTLIQRQREQSRGLEVNYTRKEVFRDFPGDGNTAVIVENVAATIKITNDSIHFDMRSSAVFEFENEQWKLIHWHASKPEMVQSEVDTFGIEEWKQKTGALEKLVAERTADLVEKNRELAIEASLERVRAVAMSMHKPDDLLQIAEVQFNELKRSGFTEIRNALIGIFHDDKNYFTDYDYSDFSGGSIANIPYHKNSIADKSFQHMKSAKDAFTEFVVEGKDLEEWKAFRKQNGEYEDTRLKEIDALYYYFYSIEKGSVGLSTFSRISPEQLNILKRFRNVFDLAYRRYQDIEQAEMQAREAQVETVLERVRSGSLAMHRSDELQEVVNTVIEQLKELNIEFDTTNILIFNNESDSIEFWTGSNSTGKQLTNSWQVSWTDYTLLKEMHKAQQTGQEVFLRYLPLEEKNRFFDHLFARTDFKNLNAERKKFIMESERASILAALVKNIAIQIVSYSRESFLPEETKILKRVAKVFEQAYTRFLDLQKAEAQTREAQVEVAVERVRAKALAMHKSEDILSVVIAMQKEFMGLNISGITATTIYLRQEDGSIRTWDFTILDGYNDEFQLRMDFTFRLEETDPDLWIRRIWNSGKNYVVVEQDEKDLERLLVFLGKFDKKAADDIGLLIKQHHITHGWHPTVSLEHGKMNVDFLEPPPAEIAFILPKMGIAFDLAYRRFLDLQKAEAQAREAKIEASLERVRARAVGMYHSDELSGVLSVLFDQFDSLGISPMYTFLSLIDLENNTFTYRQTGRGGKRVIAQQVIDLNAMDVWNDVVERWKAANYDTIDTMYVPKELVPEVFAVYSKIYSALPEGAKVYPEDFPDGMYATIAASKFGHLGYDHYKPSTDEEKTILLKFNTEFVRLYQRFLDLQKAETQAREAKVEAALEKVRSRSLAMHKSEELQEVVTAVFDRLKELGIQMDAINLDIFKENKKDAYLWTAVPGQAYSKEFHIPYTDSIIFKDIYNGMSTGKGLHSAVYSREEKNEFLEHLFAHSDFKHIPQERKDVLFATAGSSVAVAYATNTAIIAQRYAKKPFTEEETDILKRFANVFEQSYTRFRDLEKAEAQAREARIEASLERIRAKAMAMHHSEEIDEVLEVLFDQFDVLGIRPMSTHLTLIDMETNTFTFRETGKGGRKSFGEQTVAIDSMDIWKEAADRWKTLEPLSLNKLHFPKESLPVVWQVFHDSFASMPEGAKIVPEDYPDGIYHTAGNCKFGYIGMNQVRQATEEEEQIVLKFAVEFGRLYQRFLDIQKAEAQIREAKIEAALERVRSGSLAMHKSDELKGVVKIVFENFRSLGLKNIDSVNINILHKDSKEFDLWLAAPGQDYTRNFRLPYLDHPVANDFFSAVEKGETLHRKIYGFETKNSYFAYMFENSDNKYLPQERKELILNGPAYAVSAAIARHSSIFIHNYNGIPFSDHDNNILMRFARVFDQTYTRFLDLQKAEAQAKEARIEASLERVRSKAMAMHSSQGLADTIAVFYHELELFSITPRRCGVGLINKATRMAELSTMNATEPGNSIEIVGVLKLEGHPVLEGVYDNWLVQNEYHPVLKGNEIKQYYGMLKPQIEFPGYPEDTVQYGYFFYFPEGGVYTWTDKPLQETELQIYRRFTSVLSLTYKRYKDLQYAEAQAREAQIEAALERVRSRTMSMQKSDELAETAAVLFRQLINLGIAPNRLYISIIADDAGNNEFWVTDEDGSKVSKQFVGNIHRNNTIKKMYEGWKAKKKSFTLDMDGKELADYLQYLAEELKVPFKGGLSQKRRVQTIAYFSKGFIGIASPGPQPAETLSLLERFASVFNLTFTRFNDLKIAEAHAQQAGLDLEELIEEKKRTEEALAELQVTQKQLIQSEKMASLGELTAGIAHEIQNPLNFVNNFSEVSSEMLDEMVEEAAKGNYEEVKALVRDVKQNLEKINHHGKRADSIVKGMLQHTRSSSATKELTDINKLADEYLRLAYHGLRAKDKSFNATMKTGYDETIEPISIIPQDIGRVILNLITNAFYAAGEKKKQGVAGFEPTVSVSTVKTDDKVEIKVADNGNGIPQIILDKIFQPFFTTKPTGQGTGLGLSLSYDIVKAHGGEIKVSSIENEGTEFSVVLPV